MLHTKLREVKYDSITTLFAHPSSGNSNVLGRHKYKRLALTNLCICLCGNWDSMGCGAQALCGVGEMMLGKNCYLRQEPNSYCPTCGKAEGLQTFNLPLEQWNAAAKDIKISKLESDISKLEEENKNLKAEIEDLKSKIPLKPYPQRVCFDCLEVHPTVFQSPLQARYCYCQICEKQTMCFCPADFDNPEFKGHVKP